MNWQYASAAVILRQRLSFENLFTGFNNQIASLTRVLLQWHDIIGRQIDSANRSIVGL